MVSAVPSYSVRLHWRFEAVLPHVIHDTDNLRFTVFIREAEASRTRPALGNADPHGAVPKVLACERAIDHDHSWSRRRI